MKKVLILLALFIGMVVLGTFSSCSNEDDCMRYRYGTVLVVNQTGVPIWVDVTTSYTPEQESNKVIKLEDGQSTKYRMGPGGITLKASIDYDVNIVQGATWFSYKDKLGICEIYECPWIATEKKSTNKVHQLNIKDYND